MNRDRERPGTGASLSGQYRRRFESEQGARERVWAVLVEHWFQDYVQPTDVVLDLGCGWGSFINQVRAAQRFAIDLNPDAAAYLAPDVGLFQQSSADRWPLDDATLDVVFTSNFLELTGFTVVEAIPRFLPFTMAGREPWPRAVRLYLRCRPAWRLLGRQFLVTASKQVDPGGDEAVPRGGQAKGPAPTRRRRAKSR